MEKKIVLATKNKGKIKEFAAAFAACHIAIIPLANFDPLPEAVEDGQSFLENASLKAKFYAAQTQLPCLADDSGLVVDILGGAPGIYSARYAGPDATDAANNEKLIAQLTAKGVQEATARFSCCLVYYEPKTEKLLSTVGNCEGMVKIAAQGRDGFGYDPHFYPNNQEKSMAQLSLQEKNAISHRGKALEKMVEVLAKNR